MDEKLLTVVVPSYNVEKYLEECLESFVNSQVMEEVEVLIINDGSTDSTAEIGERYAHQYPRTFRVITKENGGHGSTINKGLEEAKGKYFKVVDGDDWVDTYSFISLVKKLRETTEDIVASNYTWMNWKTRLPERRQERPFQKIEYNHTYQFKDVADKVWIDMHAMTIRTDVMRRSGEKLDEHTFYVDAEYITFPIPYINSVIFMEEAVYCYRLGMPGQSMSISKMQKNLKNHFRVLMRLNEYSKKVEKSIPDYKRKYINSIVASILTSQIKIFVSFPLGSGMHKKLMKLDAYFYHHNKEAYDLVTNPAVILMRKTRYAAFPLVVAAFKYRRSSY